MTYSSNKIVKQYYHVLKRKLPYIPREKKQFLSMTRKTLTEYSNEHPSATAVDFQQEFGTIEQLCENYKDFVSEKQMISSIQRINYLNKILGTLAAILIIFLLCFFYDTYTSSPTSVSTILEVETEYINATDNTEY